MNITLRIASVSLLALASTATLQAQQVVSPVGDLDPVAPGMQTLAKYEGNTREVELFGHEPSKPHTGECRWEQVDGQFTGAMYRGTVLRSVTWRRDGRLLPQDQEATPRVVWVHVRMGLGTFNDFRDTFGANFTTNSSLRPVSVIGTPSNYQPFNLPDLRNAPPTVPAPWIVPFPFSVPWTVPQNFDRNYDAVIFSMQVDGIVTGCYPLDKSRSVAYRGDSSLVGTGCVVGSNYSPMTLRIHGNMDPTVPKYTLEFDIDWAAPNQMIGMIAGLDGQNLPIPGLCTNLYVQPIATFPLASTNAVGFLATRLEAPWLDYFEGEHFVFQAFCDDPSNRFPIKLAASNGIDHRIVASTPKVKSLFARQKDATTGALRFGEGLVLGFNQSPE